jgi:hypothetical protein
MQLTIRDVNHDFDQQTRAYAEYRAFAALAGCGTPIEEVTVTLAHHDAAGGTVACRIAVRSYSGRLIDVEAFAAHPYAAIERAVGLVSGHPAARQ